MKHADMDISVIKAAVVNVVATDTTTIATARIVVGPYVYEVAADARLDPVDTPDPELGEALAVGRALRQLGRDILKDANREVTRRAKLKAKLEERNAKRKAERLKRSKQLKKQHGK